MTTSGHMATGRRTAPGARASKVAAAGRARMASTGIMRRRRLAGLAAVMGANALGGSWYALAGAEGVPLEWLDGTPFRDYTVPGIVLGTVVGGSQLASAVALWRGTTHARAIAGGAAAILLGWIVTQLAMIGYVSFLQPLVLAWAVLTLVLAGQLGED